MSRNGRNVRTVARRRPGVKIKAVSPNGRLLVFDWFARGTWMKRLGGSPRHPHRPHQLGSSTARYLVFSPDGRRIAGAFENTSSEVAPFSTLFSIDVATGRTHFVGETWEAEESGQVKKSIGARIAW
jgi:hypothetical protein